MRRTVIAGFALFAVAGLAGCGSSTTAGSATAGSASNSASKQSGSEVASAGNQAGGAIPARTIAEISTRTTEMLSTKGSYRLKGAVNVEVPGKGGQNVQMDGAAKHSSSGISMSLDYKTSGGPGGPGGDESFAMAYQAGVLYMKLPPSAGVPADKPWVKISQDGTDPLSKVLAPMAKQIEKSADPAEQLKYLKSGAATITQTSEEKVDGIATRKYTISVDLAKLVDLTDDATMKAGIKQLTQAGVTELPYEMWLDKDDLPVQFSMVQDIAGKAKTTTKITFADWGKDVTVAIPPADQIGELPTK
ncbi:hypothetical protein F0L68_19385 [Solihabitans fulvus]|uniref:Lipoprotein LprG n=1 Tax=Solihabitans fulvus TaxID=1892852 RepID=A0A5B2XDV4_9PSEU|nr:hypothetical protein [Solihabitans fulvus]KAA2260962.1 hypothetical protein F0L68_19385 [Solihabitans fulvus]